MEFKISNYVNSVNEIIEKFKVFIFNKPCEKLTIDIRDLGLIDASKVAILCSTYHFSKYPEGKVKWVTNCIETKKLIQKMQLQNVEIEIKEKEDNKVVYLATGAAI